MSENLAETYLTKLRSESNPVALLVKFYAELFTLPFDSKLIGPMSKLVKIYGREAVFFSILSIENMENLKHDNIYPLLRFICTKRLEEKPQQVQYTDLSKYVEEAENKAKKVANSNLKVRDPFDED